MSEWRTGAFALAAGVCVALAGCTDFKKAIGLQKTSPDEFAVESRAPLTIPPDFDLRPPAPGAPRPQEASAAAKAQGVLDNAGPGDPGKQEVGTLKFPGANRISGDPTQSSADNGLAASLLQFRGPSAVVEKRETAPLQVY